MASGSQNLTSYQANKWTNLRAFTIGGTSKDVDGTAAVSWSATEILGSSDSTKFYRGDKTWSDTLTAGLNAAYIGITNTDSTTGYGLSLYGGASADAPSYGIFFGGTATFGTHGSVTGDGATYFTMNNDTSRGWIFRCGSTNVASISGGGAVRLNGALTLSGDIFLKTSSADSPDIVWQYGNTNTEQARIWMGSGSTSKWAPYYRCYDSSETQLYSGNLVLGDGTGASGSWGISVTGSSGSCTGNAASATKVGYSAHWLYAENSDEINFGGTHTGATIYMGYRARDSRPKPTNFSFGGGAASLTCGTVNAAGYLKSTSNSVTVTIGGQNSGCCHFYIDQNVPFAFNRGFLMVNSGDIGSGSYPTGNIIVKSGGRVSGNGGALYLGNSGNQSWVYTQDIASHSGTDKWKIAIGGRADFTSCYGAVWNDYAEMREVPQAQININIIKDEKDNILERTYPYAGHCVTEVGNGTMILTTQRLQKGCKIISDTFGFCIGETNKCKTPIAVTGRVLASPYEDIEQYKQHIGDFVCSGPNGTISIMTTEEAIWYPESIVGTISEIPDYEIWHCGNEDTKPINVNGRIWIYVK